MQDGTPDVVANDAGDRVTPAIVSFNSGEIVIEKFIYMLTKLWITILSFILDCRSARQAESF